MITVVFPGANGRARGGHAIDAITTMLKLLPRTSDKSSVKHLKPIGMDKDDFPELCHHPCWFTPYLNLCLVLCDVEPVCRNGYWVSIFGKCDYHTLVPRLLARIEFLQDCLSL